MNRTLLIFCFASIISNHVFSQKGTIKVVKPDTTRADTIFKNFQHTYSYRPKNYSPVFLPQYPGGDVALEKFLKDNITYPIAGKRPGVWETIAVSFTVETDGTLTGIQLSGVRNDCPACNKEALRVVLLMPKWIPGSVDGEIKKMQANVRVSFSVQ